MNEINDEGVRLLAAAIIRPAVREYVKAMVSLKRNPRNRSARMAILDLRDFFMSPWFSVISLGLDGEAMIRQIEETAFSKKKAQKNARGVTKLYTK